jgi:predicted PurR-regulated permease PerM
MHRRARIREIALVSVATVAGAIFLAWLIYLSRQVLLLIYVSGLLAVGFAPTVRAIERLQVLPIGRRIPRWVAILCVYLAILGALAGIGYAVLPTVIEQARAFSAHLPQLLDQMQRALVRRGLLAERLTMREVVQQAPIGGDTVGTVLTTLWTFVGGVFGVITILILTFYLLVDGEDLFNGFVRLFPRRRRLRVRTLASTIGRKVTAWLGGQLILSGVIGVTSAVGLGLLGAPYFYVLAVIAFVGEFIPYLGPILAAVPGIAVAASVSPKFAVVVTLFYVAQQQLENYLLVPKIMEQQVGLSPITIIIALLIGGAVMGVVGAILAVPTAAILNVLLQEVVPGNDADVPPGATG